jgi:hypothetical protein
MDARASAKIGTRGILISFPQTKSDTIMSLVEVPSGALPTAKRGTPEHAGRRFNTLKPKP